MLWADDKIRTTTWSENGHMRWSRIEPKPESKEEESSVQQVGNKKVWQTRGSRGGQQKRGGSKRWRGRDPDRDRDYMSVFFGNITSYSEHAAFYISGRSEDVLLLAETHQNKTRTLEMIAGLGKMAGKQRHLPRWNRTRACSAT